MLNSTTKFNYRRQCFFEFIDAINFGFQKKKKRTNDGILYKAIQEWGDFSSSVVFFWYQLGKYAISFGATLFRMEIKMVANHWPITPAWNIPRRKGDG